MSIRLAHNNDIPQIANLVMSLTHFYLTAPKTNLPTWFNNTLTQAAFESRLTNHDYNNYVVELNTSIVAYISIKGGDHLYHLFVSEEHQGKGMARQLWEYVMQQHPSPKYTVRSSLFAVPIYKKLGFIESDVVNQKDGISYQTMVLTTDAAR